MNLIITGGTMCKVYDPISQQMIFSEDSRKYIINALENPLLPNVIIHWWKMIDSLHMTDDTRNELFKNCMKLWKEDPEKPLIIIHGTDTMSTTAKFLHECWSEHMKKGLIILTGAFLPLTCVDSDAQFNLGYSYSAAQFSRDGVYLAMNGKFLNAEKPIVKRHDKNTFEYV